MVQGFEVMAVAPGEEAIYEPRMCESVEPDPSRHPCKENTNLTKQKDVVVHATVIHHCSHLAGIEKR
ncbi:hypothetical protein D3C85_1447970 [compost metagenome]